MDRRAELEKSTAELDAARSTAKTLAIKLKSSRCAEEDEHSACADLRNRVNLVESSQASRREVLTSIGEDMRAVSRNTELLRFLLAMTHTEVWNQNEFPAKNVVLDLNYNESAALTYTHVKRCKLRIEADIVATQSSIDWSTRSATGATSPVKDQGHYNSCWMYSTTEGIESTVFKAQGKMVEISTQQIISCNTTDGGCNGSDLLTAFKYVMDTSCIDSIDCIDSDSDYTGIEQWRRYGGSGYYYGYYYGSEQKYLEELKFRFTSELEELMTCSYQFGTKFDQAKRILSSLQIESGRETGRSVPEQGRCAFPARTTPDHKSNSFNKEREMINNLITHLKEEASEDAEHKGLCDT